MPSKLMTVAKHLAIPRGKKERKVPAGLLSGIFLHLDLQRQSQVYFGLNERELAPWFERLSEGARTAIDVGGAQGYYTLYWLLKSRVEKVFTFEPDPACFAEMQDNLMANGIVRDSRLALSAQFVGDGEKPNTRSLDSLMAEIRFPCVVKMDIEGAELDALKGCPELLSRPDVTWIVETHSENIDRHCIQEFEKAGYEVTRVRPAWWRLFLPELRPADFNSWIVAQRPRGF